MGLRSDKSPDRKKRPAFLTVQVNGARMVDEWLLVKDWPTAAAREWHVGAPVLHCWTYDSVPGAGDWADTSRCSCSLRVFASRADVLLAVGRRPRLADLYAEVEQARMDGFRADWRIADLIRHAGQCGAPDPGVVCPDDGPEFTALAKQVRAALQKEPRKEPELARRGGRALCTAAPFAADDNRHRAEGKPAARPPPVQWMKEMTMETNPTALLLELAAQAQRVSNPDTLRDLLSAGHRAWCEGIADVRARVGRETASLSDVQLAERCTAACVPWEEGMTRSEAVSALAFLTWDAAPAAMAYTELAERAARFGVCLLGEEVL